MYSVVTDSYALGWMIDGVLMLGGGWKSCFSIEKSGE
jgi:hypothetical protein